jgi:hypothetical protein
LDKLEGEPEACVGVLEDKLDAFAGIDCIVYISHSFLLYLKVDSRTVSSPKLFIRGELIETIAGISGYLFQEYTCMTY